MSIGAIVAESFKLAEGAGVGTCDSVWVSGVGAGFCSEASFCSQMLENKTFLVVAEGIKQFELRRKKHTKLATSSRFWASSRRTSSAIAETSSLARQGVVGF
jgi:hypothetical protein